MSFVDRTLTCRECGGTFTFTARDQEFYAQKGFEHEPGRCADCRRARAREAGTPRGGDRGRRGPRELHEVICADCGRVTEVPFKPTGLKPVYCRDCFSAYA